MSVNSRSAWSAKWVPAQPVLHSDLKPRCPNQNQKQTTTLKTLSTRKVSHQFSVGAESDPHCCDAGTLQTVIAPCNFWQPSCSWKTEEMCMLEEDSKHCVEFSNKGSVIFISILLILNYRVQFIHRKWGRHLESVNWSSHLMGNKRLFSF